MQDLAEARRGHKMPWNWRYQQLRITSWTQRMEPEHSEEQPVLLTTEISLQPLKLEL